MRAFCEAEFAPHAREWDAKGEMPSDALAKLAEMGFMGMRVPEEYGGAGYDAVTYGITLEEIARSEADALVCASPCGVRVCATFSNRNHWRR